MTAKISGNALK